MTEFQSTKCIVHKGFIDPLTLKTISKYLENKARAGLWGKRRPASALDECPHPSTLGTYADPLIETLLEESTSYLENLTGLALYPTYSFSRVYFKGDELVPHIDRPACEISVTVHVKSVGKPWPIWMTSVSGESIKIDMKPGDAVIYRGCEITHWRDKMVDTDINVQFMLHYVDKNGPNASYKWDTRPGLGYPYELRSK